MIKNIIFDWSGVISDTCKIQHFAVNSIFSKFGAKEISLEELKQEWEQPYMLFYNKYLPKLTRKEEKSAYEEAISKCPRPKPYPGIVTLIHKFRDNGINMILISSDPHRNILLDIKRFNLEGIFKEINSDVYDKTIIVNEAIKRNKFNSEKTIFIGDTVHEIDAGKIANIKTAAVTWGIHNESRLKAANPDFIINSLEDLKSVILK